MSLSQAESLILEFIRNLGGPQIAKTGLKSKGNNGEFALLISKLTTKLQLSNRVMLA